MKAMTDLKTALAAYYEHSDGLKVCGECDGRGRYRNGRKCPTCAGTGRYSYDSEGNRVAWTRKAWVRT